MFPLLLVAAVVVAGAAMGGKRKKRKKVVTTDNFAVVRSRAKYNALVQAGAFTKPLVVVIPFWESFRIIPLVQQVAKRQPDVFFLVAVGSEAEALVAQWAQEEDLAFIYGFRMQEISGGDPFNTMETWKEGDDPITNVWVPKNGPALVDDLGQAIAHATGQAPPEPGPEPGREPPLEKKPDITNPWAPFPTLVEMQHALLALGFSIGPVGPDGKWGSKTQAAVRDFQNYVNSMYGMDLRDDGEPDEPTRVAIGVGLDMMGNEQWTAPGESPSAPLPPEPGPEPGPPTNMGEWDAEQWEEILWSDKLFVAPDCSRVMKGNFWASQRLNPRVIAAAREGGYVFAEDILNDELAKDSPFCLDVGYDQWGSEMQEWYDDWVDLIYQDLELYVESPELLG